MIKPLTKGGICMKQCPFLNIAKLLGDKTLTNCNNCFFQILENRTKTMHCAIILAAAKSVETKELLDKNISRQSF